MAGSMDPKLKKLLLDMLCETPPVPFASDTISSSDTDTSDSEEEQYRIVRTKNFVEETVLNYGNATFHAHFRMNRGTAYMLIGYYGSSAIFPTGTQGAEKVTPEKTVLLTLWYFANAECFRQVSERFDISYSSAHRCMMRFMKFIISIQHTYLKWPTTAEKKQIAAEFQSSHNLKDVIGIIDTCHIKIAKPAKEPKSYFNCYGFHSLHLQAVCREDKSFIDVCCGEPGSLNAASVFRRSALFSNIEAGDTSYFENQYHIIGHLSYQNYGWLVAPINDNRKLTAEEMEFNHKLHSTQRVMECAFRLLKNRFRRLEYLPNLDLNICSQIIKVCCILHNICIANDDLDVEEQEEHVEVIDFEVQEAVATLGAQIVYTEVLQE